MAIIQGANSKKMRRECFKRLEEIGFPGYGFGGPPLDYEILEYTASLIPEEKIRYVMGGGTPQDILESVKMGWDLFDCVIPTRNARHGLAYTFNGTINLNQEKYQFDQKPIDPDCLCFACQHHSRAFLRHLFKVKEPLAARLTTLHNLFFYTQLMKKIRNSIKSQQFGKIYKELKDRLEG
jgi:queuine tRNA-ribosyltransferase